MDAMVFSTAAGWVGLLGRGRTICSVTLGHQSERAATIAVRERAPDANLCDWWPEARTRITKVLAGNDDDLCDLDVDLTGRTPFQRAVIAAVRSIPPGETRSYGEVAATVGRPGAARAVGTVMSSNRIPIVIPCHRVVATGGGLGGFTAPGGLALKERMLAAETGARGATALTLPART